MKRIKIFAIGFVLVLVTSGFAMHHGGGCPNDQPFRGSGAPKSASQ